MSSSEVEHKCNWICPSCQIENDKSRLLCNGKDCDYIHLPGDDIDKEFITGEPLSIQRELLLYGYINDESQLYKIIPKEIMEVINKYFGNEFTWNRDKHGDNVDFIEYNEVWYKNNMDHDKPALCITNEIINKNNGDNKGIHKWEISISKCGYPIYLGFIVYPIKYHGYNDSYRDYWNVDEFGKIHQKEQIGIYCFEGTYSIYKTWSIMGLSTRQRPRRSTNSVHLGKSIGNGDQFKFQMNFNDRTCHLYYNEKIINHGSKPLNLYPSNMEIEQIVPAVLLCRGAEYIIRKL